MRTIGTEWQRLIGCLKLQVFFHKKVTNYRALLQKITCKDKASYGLRVTRILVVWILGGLQLVGSLKL